MQKIPFDLARLTTEAAGKLTFNTLNTVRNMLTESMEWTGNNFINISKIPFIESTDAGKKLNAAGTALLGAETSTTKGLTRAIASSGNAFQIAMESLNVADETTRKAIFENIHTSSIAGESFARINISDIKPSFRLHSEDVLCEEIATDFKKSELSRAAILFPGLFCDESLWENSKGEKSVQDVLNEHGIYPIKLRFNPGSHISKNGKAALALLNNLISIPDFQNKKIDIITYSQGGLIFRSLLYQAIQKKIPISDHIRKAILISSPDGGSYLEKLGFWLGLTMEYTPLPNMKLLGMIGNQRSDAIKDLSHGIIREEDWKNSSQLKRYISDKYFGELDDIDAYQIFGLVSGQENPLHSWIGDGIVETQSLTYLSKKVYEKKENPESRVFFLKNHSHFTILQSEETLNQISKII